MANSRKMCVSHKDVRAKKEFHLFRILKYARTMPENLIHGTMTMMTESSYLNQNKQRAQTALFEAQTIWILFMWRVLCRVFLYHHY